MGPLLSLGFLLGFTYFATAHEGRLSFERLLFQSVLTYCTLLLVFIVHLVVKLAFPRDNMAVASHAWPLVPPNGYVHITCLDMNQAAAKETGPS